MSIDDLSTYLSEWPASDRQSLYRALDKAEPLDGVEVGDELDVYALAANWSESTLAKNVRSYTYWIRFLRQRGELDPDLAPSARATKVRLSAYLRELRRVSSVSRAIYFASLSYMLGAIDPNGNRNRLLCLVRILRRTATPSRDQRHLLVPPSEMFYAGLKCMERAWSAAESEITAASAYQDGLMMSAIVCKALRRSNFARILIGRNIKRNVMDIYEVRFQRLETKARRPIRAELSSKLTRYIDRWFDKVRPVLLKGRMSDAMWVTPAGTDMSPEYFYKRFCKVTEAELGHRINPHLTRKIVATGVAIARPDLVRIVGALLDQTTDQSAAYNLADELSASGTYIDLLERRRRRALQGLPDGWRKRRS